MADRSVEAAELTAAVAVLEYFASQPAPHGASPVLLRFSSESASSLFAGTYDPPTLRRLRGEAAGRLSAERARRGALSNMGLPACGVWVGSWLRQEFPLTEASISRNGFQPMTPLFLEIFLEISEISRLNGSADLSPQRKKSKNQE